MRRILIALCLYGCAASPGIAAEISPAALPNFSLPLISASPGTINRGMLSGKVAYVDFWASWCVPCRSSFPWLDAMYRKYRERGFLVVAINKDQEPAEVERFLKRYPVSFTLTTDPRDSLAGDLRVTVMPTAFLIDRHGLVRSVHRGFRSEDTAKLEMEILSLLEQP